MSVGLLDTSVVIDWHDPVVAEMLPISSPATLTTSQDSTN